MGIPGLAPKAVVDSPVKASRRSGKKAASALFSTSNNEENLQESNDSKKVMHEEVPNIADPLVVAEKRLKNLRKKLREIVALSESLATFSTEPTADQLNKLSKKVEVESEIAELELIVPVAAVPVVSASYQKKENVEVDVKEEERVEVVAAPEKKAKEISETKKVSEVKNLEQNKTPTTAPIPVSKGADTTTTTAAAAVLDENAKKIRALNKKLRQIEELEEKLKSTTGVKANPEQLERLEKKAGIVNELNFLTK